MWSFISESQVHYSSTKISPVEQITTTLSILYCLWQNTIDIILIYKLFVFRENIIASERKPNTKKWNAWKCRETCDYSLQLSQISHFMLFVLSLLCLRPCSFINVLNTTHNIPASSVYKKKNVYQLWTRDIGQCYRMNLMKMFSTHNESNYANTFICFHCLVLFQMYRYNILDCDTYTVTVMNDVIKIATRLKRYSQLGTSLFV